jgi:glycine cleavage system H protein
MSYPEDRFYTKEHEWVLLDNASNGEATIGITHFAQSELGDVIFIELPRIGKSVTKGETLCVVESTKAASDVYAPISGEVISINEGLLKAPGTLNTDPHEGGWLVKMRPSKVTSEGKLLEEEYLLSQEAYRNHIKAP